jgi:hypothetical protein
VDFTTLLLLAFLYGLMSLIRGAGKRRQDAPPPVDLEDDAGPALEPPATRTGRRLPSPRGAKSPTAGATRLEEFLREFERRVAEAGGLPTHRGPMGRRESAPLAGAEEVEELESLEVEPEIRVLGGERIWQDRLVVDEASAAEAVHQGRMRVEARPLTAASHRSFDQRVRRAEVAADAEIGARAARLAQLRQAIILNEVLGKPKGLRS